jgi:hypothetical protein
MYVNLSKDIQWNRNWTFLNEPTHSIDKDWKCLSERDMYMDTTKIGIEGGQLH